MMILLVLQAVVAAVAAWRCQQLVMAERVVAASATGQVASVNGKAAVVAAAVAAAAVQLVMTYLQSSAWPPAASLAS